MATPTELPAFLQQSKSGSKFVDLEWQQRNRLASGLQPSQKENPYVRLTGDEIIARNRYLNVEPYANNRVKLQVAEGLNDYINASPIVLGERRYIATQGPKDTSTSHFYRMLAAECASPAVIVMLTQTHEAGREKCFQYFPFDTSAPLRLSPDPDIDDGFEGEIVLESIEEDPTSRSTVRKMRLRTRMTEEGKEGVWQEKEVYHLLFSGWPDFLIPEGEDRIALTELIHLSGRLNSSPSAPTESSFKMYPYKHIPSVPSDAVVAKTSSNPRVVHCSAGVGRSGTFIAMDYLLALLDAGILDNVPVETDVIAETVDELRKQRMMMVQGEGQFMFLYEALRDAWLARWSARNGGS